MNLLLHIRALSSGDIRWDGRILRFWKVTAVGVTFLVNEIVSDPVPATVNVPTHGVDVNAIAKVIVNAEEVVLVTSRSASTEAKSNGADRRSPHKPTSEVNLMDKVG